VRAERFVQLHPLIHEFAREKIGLETELTERYADAVENWLYQTHHTFGDGRQLPSLRLHQADLLQVFEHWARQAEWRRILNSFWTAFEFFFLESLERTADKDPLAIFAGHLPSAETQEIILLRAMLLNAQADRHYASSDIDQAAPLWESVQSMLKDFQPEPELAEFYNDELATALEGKAKWLKEKGRSAEALAFLRLPEVASALECAKVEDTQYLTASILADQGEHAQALAILRSIQENYQRNSNSRFAKIYILVEMADRQRDLGQWDEAIQLYEAAFAEEQYPPFFRAAYGRSLVDCLRERQDFQRMEQVLETMEELLEGNPADLFKKNLAQVWEDRAETRLALSDREGALVFAQKALALAEQFDDSDRLERLQGFLKQLS